MSQKGAEPEAADLERELLLCADCVEKVRSCQRGAALIQSSPGGTGVRPMMGERRSGQEALFYEFSLERHVPAEHLLRSIDRFVELDGIRCELGKRQLVTAVCV